MMVKHYIVTYKNPHQLNKGLRTLFSSGLPAGVEYKVYVINNHTEFLLEDAYHSKVTVLHNVLRPDGPTGHLARNWNQALINGFVDLSSPDCDIVICSQDDVEYAPGFLQELIALHSSLDFIQIGAGDSLISYTPDAVKQVGLWDERFCNIGHQESDYFLRVLKFCPRHSINDHVHCRVSKPVQADVLIPSPTGCARREHSHLESLKYHSQSTSVFVHKWGIPSTNWSKGLPVDAEQRCPNYVMYPYFEKNVQTLREQLYILG